MSTAVYENEKSDKDSVVPAVAVLADSDLHLDELHRNEGGAPIEDVSPIGIQVGWWTAVFLNFSQMIGTGIFSTPGTILRQCGSFGLAMIFWVIGFLLGAAGLSYYTELLALFPNRAGADVAYLEQAYHRPKFLFPVSFAVITIILGFASSNAIVCAEYILYAHGDNDPNPWTMRGIAIAAYGLACIIVVINNRLALAVSNVLSLVKVIILIFVVVTGWVVLGGHTRVENPRSHFKDGFAGTTNDGNALAGAMINVIFAYAGWNNANNVANEMANPVKTVKTAGPFALGIVFFLYLFANIAYIAAIPVEVARESKQLLAAKFFSAVFGDYAGSRVLPVLVALSAFGNLVSVAVGQARVFREVARQGVFPFSKFFASTKPFGTPAAPMLLKFILTTIVIIGPPAGDAFNLIVSIQTYPNRLFDLALVIGVYAIRRRRAKAGLPPPEYVSWHIALWFSIAVNLFVLIMPWVPPTTNSYSFPYYVPWVTGIGVLAFCFGYWAVWMHVLPRIRGYKIYEEVTQLDNGELSKTFVNVYHDERGDVFREKLRRDAIAAAAADSHSSEEKISEVPATGSHA
ncbi:high-affinity methionine permease [Cylindrobasidium torrendii FP15055 ss-10]|uniref:High-affinity methionine permease n=1 Tax=Cylindrobasidium torrendii FP15055 ss-10 TaxID=1314674 RepID=A0A0D7ATM4_9AGAR|nr:high-affinity methionine permease [Cylindrobasidium torrendii FP15055 ss-10]